MAVLEDMHAIRNAMKETEKNPNQCRYVHHIQITYVPQKECWIADWGDIRVYFDRVVYVSNEIMFWNKERKAAQICHYGLTD